MFIITFYINYINNLQLFTITNGRFYNLYLFEKINEFDLIVNSYYKVKSFQI